MSTLIMHHRPYIARHRRSRTGNDSLVLLGLAVVLWAAAAFAGVLA